MKKIYYALTGLCSITCIQAQTLVFQSATPAYPDRALTHTFTNVGSPAVDVAIAITGSASFGNNTPKVASTGLTNQPNFSNNTSTETYTFTFSKPVQNLYFSVGAIDQGIVAGSYQDQLAFSAVDGTGTSLTPAISSSVYYTVSGNVVTATATNNATAYVSFSGYVKTLTIRFGNGPNAVTNPAPQGFTIGTLNWTSVLPVTLVSFTAKPEGDRVQLAWTTTWERDADRFIVERSTDLREFVTVGEFAAKGTTDQRQDYGLTDMNPKPGVNYYRLKQLDFDGTTHLFKPVASIIDASEPVVAVYPNPTNGERMHLRLWNADEAIIRLLNSRGEPIESTLERRPGEADVVPARPLSTGLYWLETQVNDRRRTTKVVVP